MKIVIVFPDVPGCRHDSEVLRAALTPILDAARDVLIVLPVVEEGVYWDRATAERRLALGDPPDCVFFIEGLLDHSSLLLARHRILLANPEWLEPAFVRLAGECDYFWHKSHSSIALLAASFPQAQHVFVGFTSNEPGVTVSNYTRFLHARGNVWSRRNTDAIVECWNARADWPELDVHSYGGELKISQSAPLNTERIRLQSGWLPRSDYLKLAVEHGVHLCTSEVEGFGHYINEARGLGALVVTTDAAPMNELIDEESGVLVPPSSSLPCNFGIRHLIDAHGLSAAIDRVVGSSLASRRRLGASALYRFYGERDLFLQRVAAAMDLVRV